MPRPEQNMSSNISRKIRIGRRIRLSSTGAPVKVMTTNSATVEITRLIDEESVLDRG